MAIEAQDGVKTVECLRGRLLAERVASKAAKTEAENMAKRLAELEKQLEEEMKQRRKAEKRLNLALKKLESLKVLDFPSQIDYFESSASSNSPNRFEKLKDLGQSESRGRDFVGENGFLSNFKFGSCNSVGTASSWNKDATEGDEGSSSADSVVRQSSENTEKLHFNDINSTEQHIEEILALVPVNSSQESASFDPEFKNNTNVYDVLFALRHVKEQLQNSIERTVSFYCTKGRVSNVSMETESTKQSYLNSLS